jgi:hypothetical protein
MDVKKLKAYLFVDEKGGTKSEGHTTAHQGYTAMIEWLTMYVTACNVVKEIRPFQLSYRQFNIYLVDVGGYPTHTQRAFMTALGNVVRGRPSRLYLFWTGETWESFCTTNPDLRGHDTCINCCAPDAMEKIEEMLLDMDD